MKRQGKKIGLIFIFVLLSFWISKQLGYPILWYCLNAYYNINNQIIENHNYKVTLPFFQWRIASKDKTSINLKGVTPERTFINASISNINENLDLQTIKNWCEGNSKINLKKLETHSQYVITCDNSKNTALKPYKLYWVPYKLLIFMYNYQKNYEYIYEKLLYNIEIK